MAKHDQPTGIALLKRARARLERGWVQGTLRQTIEKSDWNFGRSNKKGVLVETYGNSSCHVVPGNHEAYCIAGAMDGYASELDKGARRAAWDNLTATLPKRFLAQRRQEFGNIAFKRNWEGEYEFRGSQCVEYNDRDTTTFSRLIAWVDRAIARAEAQKESSNA